MILETHSYSVYSYTELRNVTQKMLIFIQKPPFPEFYQKNLNLTPNKTIIEK